MTNLERQASLIDICKFKHGYWWNSKQKFEALISKHPFLQEITIQITDRCNLACPKCNKTSFEDKDMPTLEIIRILSESLKLGLKHVHLTGGEPTLHPYLPEIIKFCKDNKIRVDMSSNGYFTRDTYKLIAKAGISSINVSWDYIEQPPPCLDFVFKYKPEVFLNHMVIPDNYQELLDFLKLIKDKYRRVVDIQLMPPRGTADKFSKTQIKVFNEIQVAKVCEISKNRFPMVQRKISFLLGENADKGIYHEPIFWPCHRAKMELRVGNKGFSTCTYLYRDGTYFCKLKTSVKDALEICMKKCSGKPGKHSCDVSCSPEVAYFNYNVENTITMKKIMPYMVGELLQKAYK